MPGAPRHLELVDSAEITPVSTVEDLLVIYLETAIEQETIERIHSAGGVRVAAHNPYWEQNGVTFADPDGYLCVLSTRSWSSPLETQRGVPGRPET